MGWTGISVPDELGGAGLGFVDELVVGMEDGKGSCVGIGVLEYDASEDLLRMVSPVTEGVRGLRLGSIKIDTEGHEVQTVQAIAPHLLAHIQLIYFETEEPAPRMHAAFFEQSRRLSCERLQRKS